MYLSHFKLREKPFQLNTDPRFLWLGRKHKEALATLQYGVLENKGLLLLTGDIGTGKTTLISALVDLLGDKRVVVAKLPDPGLTRKEFFCLVSRKFGIDRAVSDKATFTEAFGEFLDQICAHDQKALLIIDESQTMSDGVLEEIRLLSNWECRNSKPLNIFLVGQNEFNQKLLKPANRAIKERIAVSYNLEPLDEHETAAYIAHRLQVAGAQQKIFTDDALREIHSFSQGAPRKINILCDLALVRGYAENIESLDRRMIIECEQRIIVRGDAAAPLQGSVKAPREISLPEINEARPKAEVGRWRKPAALAARYGLLALVILVPGIYISYALWNSGLISAYLPALDKRPPPSGLNSPDSAPAAKPTPSSPHLDPVRVTPSTDIQPSDKPRRDVTSAADPRPSPPRPQAGSGAAEATAAKPPMSPPPARDGPPSVLGTPQPPRSSEPRVEKPSLSPLQRPAGGNGPSPVDKGRDARQDGDRQALEASPPPAKTAVAPPPAPQDAPKEAIPAEVKTSAVNHSQDTATKPTAAEDENAVQRVPSTEPLDPAGIIEWLLKEKSKAKSTPPR